MKMDLTKLKEKLLNIREQEKLLRDHFEAQLSDLKETERIIIEAYIVSNAVYRPFEKVLRKIALPMIGKPALSVGGK